MSDLDQEIIDSLKSAFYELVELNAIEKFEMDEKECYRFVDVSKMQSCIKDMPEQQQMLLTVHSEILELKFNEIAQSFVHRDIMSYGVDEDGRLYYFLTEADS